MRKHNDYVPGLRARHGETGRQLISMHARLVLVEHRPAANALLQMRSHAKHGNVRCMAAFPWRRLRSEGSLFPGKQRGPERGSRGGGQRQLEGRSRRYGERVQIGEGGGLGRASVASMVLGSSWKDGQGPCKRAWLIAGIEGRWRRTGFGVSMHL